MMCDFMWGVVISVMMVFFDVFCSVMILLCVEVVDLVFGVGMMLLIIVVFVVGGVFVVVFVVWVVWCWWDFGFFVDWVMFEMFYIVLLVGFSFCEGFIEFGV